MKQKQLFLLLILTALSIRLTAQERLLFKPFSPFNKDITLMNDTIAYLDYNFGKEGRGIYYYSERTVADVIQDLELPIKAAGRISTVGKRKDKKQQFIFNSH